MFHLNLNKLNLQTKIETMLQYSNIMLMMNFKEDVEIKHDFKLYVCGQVQHQRIWEHILFIS